MRMTLYDYCLKSSIFVFIGYRTTIFGLTSVSPVLTSSFQITSSFESTSWNWQSAFQSVIMSFYKHGVKKTCIALGDKAYFEETDRKHRVQLWKAIFRSDSIKMVSASLAGLCEAVAVFRR